MKRFRRSDMRFLSLTLLAVLFVAAPLPCQKTAPKEAKDDSAVVKGELGKMLEKTFLQKKHYPPEGPSGIVLVAKGGEILLAKGYGVFDEKKQLPMRADSIWDWASVSKQWTAAAILKLEMQKKIGVDWPLTKVYAEAPKDKAGVTIKHLLDHTSGIQHDPDFRALGVNPFDRDAVVRAILALPMRSAPGSKWEYSNVAYFLLGAVIEKVSGKSYESYMIDEIFRPAGMKDASIIGDPSLDLKRVPNDKRGQSAPFAYGPKLSWGYRGAGAVMASARDVVAWDRALRGKKLLSEEAKKKLFAPGANDYALGWFVKKEGDRTAASHTGAVGEIKTGLWRGLDEDIVCAVAFNMTPLTYSTKICEELADVVRRGKLPPGVD